HPGTGLGHDVEHPRVRTGGHVVDDLGACLDCGLGDSGLGGVDRYDGLPCQSLDHGEDATDLGGGVDRVGARSGGFTPDVDDVRTVGDEASGVGDGPLRVDE